MQFNRRVLEEAEDAGKPAAGAGQVPGHHRLEPGRVRRNPPGRPDAAHRGRLPRAGLRRPAPRRIAGRADRRDSQLCGRAVPCWNDRICCPSCASRASGCWSGRSWTKRPAPLPRSYFQREVDPLLTPISIDPAHPFRACSTRLSAWRCCSGSSGAAPARRFGGGHGAARAAPLRPPALGRRRLRLPAAAGLIAQNLAGMYRGYEVLARAAFRVTRNSNLYFEEEEARSLLETIRVELHNRRKGDAVRLEIETGADAGDRRAAARQLRARRGSGLPRRRPGEPLAADVLLWRRAAARPEVPAFTPKPSN
jgi:polyphosphate kinase